jgi:hypothetical protein
MLIAQDPFQPVQRKIRYGNVIEFFNDTIRSDLRYEAGNTRL